MRVKKKRTKKDAMRMYGRRKELEEKLLIMVQSCPWLRLAVMLACTSEDSTDPQSEAAMAALSWLRVQLQLLGSKLCGQLLVVRSVRVQAVQKAKIVIIILLVIYYTIIKHQFIKHFSFSSKNKLSRDSQSTCQKIFVNLFVYGISTDLEGLSDKSTQKGLSMSDSEDTVVIVNDRSMFQTMNKFCNWSQIQAVLKNMAKGEYSSEQIYQNLKRFRFFSMRERGQQKKFDKKMEFQALQQLYDDYLPELMEKISVFVLSKTDYEYPMFKRQQKMEHTFTKNSILFLICSMTLCLIPKQGYHLTEHGKEFYSYQTDFSFIFQKSKYKTKCIVEYLKAELKKEERDSFLTIRREVIENKIQELMEANKEKKLCKLTMNGDNQSIQDFYGDVKVDFANKYIGGGALSSGCVQEEIMFANHPELFACQLLCEVMDDNEAFHLVGFKKYWCNKGYSYNTSYLGPDLTKYQFDQQKRVKEYITVIDASVICKEGFEQYRPSLIKREMLKAYAGFLLREGSDKIVTGNWGCGAFGGDIKIKLIIQWLACTLVSKQMIYCPFGQRQKVFNRQLFVKLSQLRIGEVYSLLKQAGQHCLKQYGKELGKQVNFYDKMMFLLKVREEQFDKRK